MKTRGELRQKFINKQKQKEWLEGVDGGATLIGVQKFLEDNGIRIKTTKEYEEYTKSTEHKRIKKGAAHKGKKKGNIKSVNPLNPNDYIYRHMRIVKG